MDNDEWIDLYPDTEEYTSVEYPEAKNTRLLHITFLADATNGSCYVTRRSVTRYLGLIGKAVIKSYSKRQNTVETSTYGSELVAMRIAMEAMLELRFKLREMGVGFYETSTILCDNEAVVKNMQLPSSTLKKKHNACAYHRCREMIAASIARVGHISGTLNTSDIMTKPKGPMDYYRLLKGVLFRKLGYGGS